MKVSALACRIYRINPILIKEVKNLLLQSKANNPLYYDTIKSGKEERKLFIVIRSRTKNEYGYEIRLWIDHYTRLRDRDNTDQIVRYYKEYQ